MTAGSVPAAVLRTYPDAHHATIAEVFYPDGRGWLTLRGRPIELDRLVSGTYRKRVTPYYARKLRAEGATVIALDLGDGRTADFQLTELATA